MTRLNLPVHRSGVKLHAIRPDEDPAGDGSARAHREHGLRQGKVLMVAGWLAATAGILVYCVASFAGRPDADLPAIALHGAIPAARAGLFLTGCGTLTWIVGSVLHLEASLDVPDDEPGAP